MTFDWNPWAGGAGEFVKWTEPGDQVVGTVVAIRVHEFDKEKGPIPLIDLEKEDGEQVTVSVDKVDLTRQITALAPQAGDKLAIRFTGEEKTPNGRKKVFAIRHKAGERKPVAPAEPVWSNDDSDYVDDAEAPF